MPTCRYALVLLPVNSHSGGNPWSSAAILTVRHGSPVNPGCGGSFASRWPFTPSWKRNMSIPFSRNLAGAKNFVKRRKKTARK